MPARPAMMNTMMVVIMVSFRVGQVTFGASARPSCRNLNGLTFAMRPCPSDVCSDRPERRAGPQISPYIYAKFPEKPLARLEGELKPGRSGGAKTTLKYQGVRQLLQR